MVKNIKVMRDRSNVAEPERVNKLVCRVCLFFLGARTWFLGKVTKIDFQARRTPYTPVSRLLEDDAVDLEVILSDLAPASQSLHSVDADSGT